MSIGSFALAQSLFTQPYISNYTKTLEKLAEQYRNESTRNFRTFVQLLGSLKNRSTLENISEEMLIIDEEEFEHLIQSIQLSIQELATDHFALEEIGITFQAMNIQNSFNELHLIFFDKMTTYLFQKENEYRRLLKDSKINFMNLIKLKKELSNRMRLMRIFHSYSSSEYSQSVLENYQRFYNIIFERLSRIQVNSSNPYQEILRTVLRWSVFLAAFPSGKLRHLNRR